MTQLPAERDEGGDAGTSAAAPPLAPATAAMLASLPGCVAVDPGRLYLCCLSVDAVLPEPGALSSAAVCYILDGDLEYEPFCADFGPCNLARTWRVCETLRALCGAARASSRPVLLLVGAHPHAHANAATAVGAYLVLVAGWSAARAQAALAAAPAAPAFRDASSGTPLFGLGISDVVAGLARARDAGFLRWHAGEVFDVEEYEHFEQVENGDMNWIVPGKLLAFSGPSSGPRHACGWRTFTPEDYAPLFHARGVVGVVRLNRAVYDSTRFTAAGLAHHELYFPDGTCPTPAILARFLALAERTPAALAVHCKAGLGRTGVLICSYMIKHHGFTAEEAMGYIRVARPGSVIGPQQLFLKAVGPELAAQGAASRALHAPRLSAFDCTELNRSAPSAESCTAELQARGDQENDAVERPLLAGTTGRTVLADCLLVETTSVVSKNGPGPAVVHLHVHAGMAPSPAPVGLGTPQRSGSVSSVGTPPATVAPRPAAPPSSTKRVLAPNGQPRKIPLAMEFDKALHAELEDRGMEDGEGAWRLSAQLPAHIADQQQPELSSRSSRSVGGTLASMIGALRSAVGAQRCSN